MKDKEDSKKENFDFNLLEDENIKNYNNLPDNKKSEATLEDLAYLPNYLSNNNLIIVKNTIEKANKYKLIKKDPIEKVILFSQSESLKVFSQDVARLLYEDKKDNYIYLCDNSKTKEQAITYIKDYIEKNAILIQDTCFDPTNNELFIKKNHQTHLNLFKWSKLLIHKPTYTEYPGVKCDFILKVINNLCDNNEEQFNYIISWLAHLYQRPAKKFQTALIFTGAKGAGKGTLAKVLEHIFEITSLLVGSNDLNSRFKEHMFSGQKLLIIGDEVLEDSKNRFANELKQYITEVRRPSEGKGKQTRESNSYEKWIFFSNNPAPFKIEEGDRRYAVFKASENLRNIIDINQIREFHLEGDNSEPSEFFKNEVIGFCCYLNNIILDPEVIEYPIMTDSKREIILAKQPKIRTILIDIFYKLKNDIKQSERKRYYWLYCESVREKYNNDYPNKQLSRIEFESKIYQADFIKQRTEKGQIILIPKDIAENILNPRIYFEKAEQEPEKEKSNPLIKEDLSNNEERTENPKEEYTKQEIFDYFVSKGKITKIYDVDKGIKILKDNNIIYEPKNEIYKINNAVKQNE